MTVRLPLRSQLLEITPSSDLESTAAALLEVDSQEVPSLAGLQILAVDDDEDSRNLFKYRLEEVGAEVVGVGSAREATAALRASPERFDVLLADIGMPDEDGFSLIRQVRALEAGGQIPAAAITAYVSDQERQRAIESGFQKHLAKPVNWTQLIRTIAELVGRSL
ncbi:response regulator [Cyanobacteria bacterium FACHB-DQ100]|nr:response regulator [Cyanobacteria bacterium FACHB-DQ100]